MVEIEGIVENIKFRNEENGYTVALFSAPEDTITIVGKFLNINVGEALKIQGDFNPSKYGEQFSVEKYETVAPRTQKGIVKYLSSGLIRGIGPVTAQAIVDKFGIDTLEVIEFNPEKLLAVRGVSKKKIEIISQSFLDVKEMQNAMIFLQAYNISSNLAIKIYEFYRGATIEIVKNNPYRLVEDIRGVGFKSADDIAMNMGIARNSEFRVRAGILHLLDTAEEREGHTFQYRAQIDNMLSRLLKLEFEECCQISAKVYDILVKESVIKLFWKDKKELIANAKMYNTERAIGAKLALLNASGIDIKLNVEDEIKVFEQRNKLTFHEDQKNAIRTAVNSGVSIITGGPGTGKTTIISCILEIFKMLRKRTYLLAPTGRAAKRLGEATGETASTIHRALEIDFRQNKGMFVYNDANPLPCDVMIVDEVSMVDVSLMNSLLKAIARGAKLILVGDKDQLPSVGAGNVLADILASEMIPVAELTKVYRQEGNSLIVSNAHLINKSEMPLLDNKNSDFFFEQKDSVEGAFDSVIELTTKRIPKFLKVDSSKIQVLASLKAGVCGVENLNAELQARINPPSFNKRELKVGSMILRENDKVMQIANNYNLSWTRKIENTILEEGGMGVFNGDIGTISAINTQVGEVEVLFDDKKKIVYPRSELSQIVLSYAITIHKSQGSEFDVVVIPVVGGPPLILTKNLIYTAVTRAKKMVVLVGQKAALIRMIKNTHTAKRYTLLKDFLVEEGQKMKLLYGE